VTINTDFTQSIIPGDDATYALGADAGDSTSRRWSQVHARDWTGISTGAWPGSGLISPSVTISDQINIDGLINKISAIQSNEDVLLNPDTGSIYIESVKFVMSVDLTYALNNPNPIGSRFLDSFGNSVAISGNYAIIGAYQEDDAASGGGSMIGLDDSGKAYIFNVTTGALVHTLNNPNAYGTNVNDNFGNSVAISGNYAIVGAYREDDAGGTTSGKAYIYNVTTGALVHTLNNPNAYGTSTDDQFGYKVAMSGNYAIVGAYGEDEAAGTNSGKVYIYNVTTGALVYTLTNPNAYGTITDDRFGISVAMSGNYAIVGAYGEGDAGGTTSGKAYIFNVTTGALVHTLNNPNAYDTSADDNFGNSVAISGNYAIVGARYEDDAGGLFSGKAYIYNVTTGALLHTLNNPDADGISAGDSFGNSVAISGNYAIVGASLEGDEHGIAYIFNVTNGALIKTLTNPNPYGATVGGDDAFGISVAISDNYVIVGAYGEDEAPGFVGINSGKAYVYQIEFDQSIITNQLNTPLTFSSTGIGYLRFTDTNGFVVPAGTNLQRRASPEVGETRWNTQIGYLECYDGSVWAVSTGGGINVSVAIMEDLGHAYTLMLG
jgi:hypothetical protein